MKVAVISDLHLGIGDQVDGFGHDDAEFLKFLQFLEGNFERIVLLGDVWETLHCRKFGNVAAELDAARAAHPEIARRFSRSCYSYVHGNHDLIAGATLGAPESLSLEADGVRLLFTHGHQGDPLIEKRAWLADICVWLGGWIRRCGFDALYRLCAELDHARGALNLNPDSCPFQKWAMNLAAKQAADVVITGHTHMAARQEHGSRLFMNSGSCNEGRLSFLSIDTKLGNYAVNCSY
jgi:predicted phosphodiesterase